MANDEVLGPRKTMFILVIVVGCFAILWPRILSPLIVGHTKQQLQPNQFDRDAGCCEVMFGSELAVLELINEVCSSAVHVDGKINPYAAAECRKAVNETCGVDIAAFLKRTENVGKTSKILVRTMQSSNSSCLKEHFGVPVMSLGPHLAINSWDLQDTMKQERSPIRGAGPHPALRERGRAIPAGAPSTPRSSQTQMPPHVRVRSPLEGYFQLDIKPPPIPGMRPPLGNPGGPQAAPKSSMGLVMPIYTLCIIIFFVYTLSKIFFKSTAEPYDEVTPDPHFRKRVFRDDSRTTPDKLGHKEKDTNDMELEALSARMAETERMLHKILGHLERRDEERQDNARPYTNGTVLHNSGPVHIIASEYQKDKSRETSPEQQKSALEVAKANETESVVKEVSEIAEDVDVKAKESKDELIKEADIEGIEAKLNDIEVHLTETVKEIQNAIESKESDSLVDLTEPAAKKNGDILSKVTEDFIEEAKKADDRITKELLEEALDDEEDEKGERSSVKVVGMEVRAESADGAACPARATPPPRATPAPRTPHSAEEVQSIFLDTEIPQKSRVLVDFADDVRDAPPAKHSPMVVSGKMTLSLIQDARDTPERDAESTVDDFTTASAVTQDAAEKEGDSEEEIGEEIEVEEEEEVVEPKEETINNKVPESSQIENENNRDLVNENKDDVKPEQDLVLNDTKEIIPIGNNEPKENPTKGESPKREESPKTELHKDDEVPNEDEEIEYIEEEIEDEEIEYEEEIEEDDDDEQTKPAMGTKQRTE